MKVAVTGAAGQLGSEVANGFSRAHEIRAFDREQLDITDYDRVMQILGAWRCDAIVNCAAFTDVDRCETEADKAYEVNALAVRNLAEAAEMAGAQLCHVSTDYVFDGRSDSYREWDAPAPLSVYGASKHAGEREVQAVSGNWLIVRTAWVYGQVGHNFVKTMLMLAAEQTQIEVVDDQRGSPSYAKDVAAGICDLVLRRRRGIFHMTNSGETTWYQFAKAIFEEAGLDAERVRPTKSETIRRPAPRPKSSVLENFALARSGTGALRHWREALTDFMSTQEEL